MYKIDKDKVRNILIAELDYKPNSADFLLRNYPLIHDELVGAVEAWLKNRTFVDVDIFGISIGEVMRVRGVDFLQAVRTINRLLDADITHERREQMVKDLRQPIIRW